ncbi:MAG: H-NS histone family protein [Xanthomonadales bacterium]|nr:H-NS histone family protein [Xanthomonadales bacterium]
MWCARRSFAAKDEGYTIAELFGTSTGTAKARGTAKGSAKYANPADSSQTWTGRGKRPGWFKLAIERAFSRPACAI